MDNPARSVSRPGRRTTIRIIGVILPALAVVLTIQTYRALLLPLRPPYHRHSNPEDMAASSLAEARSVLQGAAETSASFFTLDPEELGLEGKIFTVRYLRDWKILSEKSLDSRTAAEVLSLLKKEGTYFDGGALCFDPGLGFRFQRGESFVELVICLDCNWVYAYTSDEHFRWSLTPEAKQELLRVYRSQVPSDTK